MKATATLWVLLTLGGPDTDVRPTERTEQVGPMCTPDGPQDGLGGDQWESTPDDPGDPRDLSSSADAVQSPPRSW